MKTREVYYENSHVWTRHDYRKFMDHIEDVPSKRIRKIYFNEDLNAFGYAENSKKKDLDLYSIVMIDFDKEHLMIERESHRSGMIYKDYAPLTGAEYEKIIHGDYQWLQDHENPICNHLFLEISINQRNIGWIVEYEQQRFHVYHTKDYIDFDGKIRSAYVKQGDITEDFLSESFKMEECLDEEHVVMHYKKGASMAPIFERILALMPACQGM